MKAEFPDNEVERLAALRSYEILDTLPEQAYDDITHLASQITGTPIALVSLVDEDRQWFKSRHGLDVPQTPRDVAFCAHAIREPDEVLIVPDATADDRFKRNPLVTDDPHIRFYAGVPLVTERGEALGTLCVIDREPRALTTAQHEALRALGRQVMAQLELRLAVRRLRHEMEERQRYAQMLETYQLKLEAQNAALEIDRMTDALTGLKNRRAFDDRLEEEYSRSRRHDHPTSILVADIDHFKSYNDSFGHPAGDEVLKVVDQLLQAGCRTTDIVARLGGEEFAMILPNTDPEGALILAHRLRSAIERHAWPHRAVTMTVGVATSSSTTPSASELLNEADRAMYDAKRAGRNRVTVAA